MAAERSSGPLQGRPRGQPLPGRSTASPLTPRLAANATATKRDPSPRRAFVKASSSSRDPSPEKRATPVRALTSDLVTPRSSVVRPKLSRPASTVSTPGSITPSSIRGGPTYASPRLAAQQTPTDREGRGALRGTPGQDAPYRRDFPTPSPLSQGPIVLGNAPRLDGAPSRPTTSMFFHADEAKSQVEVSDQAPPVLKTKRSAFFYADGKSEDKESSRLSRETSPPLSSLGDRRNLVSSVKGTSVIGSAATSRQRVVSPAFSAVSLARSPFALSPGNAPRSHSPTKTDYLNTPNATINHQRIRDRVMDNVTARAPVANALGVTFELEPARPHASSPRGHNKSMSICAMPAESPNSARKRSATWTDAGGEQSPVSQPKSYDILDAEPPPPFGSPTVGRANFASGLTSPIISDPMQSPAKELVDYAADARRERKVLDLEISNSSLLAINKTLEREVKKHKAELKRYRRLSRAGRFSVAPGALSFDDDADGYDGLPHIDGAFVGRPSSPFEEDVSDLDISDGDQSSENEDGTLSPGAQATKEERQRARDEAQLRNDLRKHRELLLDTARMNRSLQRCLTWTEDLIKDGKKALAHQIRSEEIRLGGRVLDEDEDALATSNDALDDSIISDAALDDGVDGAPMESAAGDDYTGVEAFLGMGPWQQQQQRQHKHLGAALSDRMSVESESTNRDSGVEMNKTSRHQGSPRTMASASLKHNNIH